MIGTHWSKCRQYTAIQTAQPQVLESRTIGHVALLTGYWGQLVTRSTVFLSPDKLQGPLFQVQTHVRVSLPLLKQFRVAQIQLLFAQIGDSMALYPLHYKVLDAMQPPASLSRWMISSNPLPTPCDTGNPGVFCITQSSRLRRYCG